MSVIETNTVSLQKPAYACKPKKCYVTFEICAAALVGLNETDYRARCFLDAFVKLRKATTSFVMSFRPSVRPRGTTRLPLDGF